MPVRTTGALLAGRYRTIERIGSGGMATVLLAEDERLGRKVAVKRLHAETPADTERRFRREARLQAALNHPNLVAIYDTHADDEGVLIVMEYVDGETLADALRRGPLAPPRALEVLRGLAGAVDYAHGEGIVHRDVKPANVLLGTDGRIKLADLGIATAVEGTRITMSGTVLGTAAYMAPEQLEGHSPGPVADIYSLGVVAWESLSGKRAYEGRTPLQIAHRKATESPPDLTDAWPEAPAAAALVLARAMDPDPAQRPESAVALVSELAAALGEGTAATRALPDRNENGRPRAAAAAAPVEPAAPAAPVEPPAPQPAPAAAQPPAPAHRPAPPAPAWLDEPQGAQAQPAERTAPRAKPSHEPTRPRSRPAAEQREPVRQSAAAPPASPPPSPDYERHSFGRRRPAWIVPAAVLAALAAVALVAVLALSSGGSDSGQRDSTASGGSADKQQPSDSSKDSGTDEPESSATPAPAEEPQSEQREEPSAAAPPADEGGSGYEVPQPSGDDPGQGASLNSQGKALSDAGRHDEAIPVLERAVRSFPPGTDDVNYAYALFNLGHALKEAGRPEDAIPVLEERLTIDNQRATVQRELDDARAQAGQG
jgi:serine/threonine-protein kinase